MNFEISELRQSSIWQLFRMRDRIDFDPDYQRLSDIWTNDKRQLLLDTILNGFDVPKLYLHKFARARNRDGRSFEYAIIDGKQRLEAIFGFIQGDISLAEDFEYLEDKNVDVAGATYDELGLLNPDLKADFDGFRLHVVCIETEDLELIEEMFSRLNEAVPLSAAEKRNAFGGPVPVAVRRLAKETFFTRHLPFPNSRYRHFDLAAKFLYFEFQEGVADTKKAYLDNFVRQFSKQPKTRKLPILTDALKTCERMSKIFTQKDPLLRQVGMVALYYLLFQEAARKGWASTITRKRLLDFEKMRESNRQVAESDLADAEYNLIEFDRLSQSPNDASALAFRLRVLALSAFNREIAIEP